MDIKDFKHKIQVRVRTFEIDSQGIVHNSNYLKYLEIGRVEYKRNLGYKILKNGVFDDGLKVVVVHNSMDYKGFAFMDDLLNIYTRILWIKNSSFCFEQIIEKDSDQSIILEGKGILVNLNPKTNFPETIEDKFVKEIEVFENRKLKIENGN
jgi:acyl-CoA thioester hydrolase